MVDALQEWQVTGNVKSRIGHLLNTGLWTDCQFLVGTESNCKLIGAHKLILCMSSPVFQAMLRGQLAENEDTIQVPDIEPLIFEWLLKYIYTDDITKGSVDETCKLYYAADKYMFPIVKDHCLSQLLSVINAKNVLQIYEFAKFYNNSTLIDKCLAYIESNAKTILNDESLMESQLNVIIELFDRNSLCIDSDLDLYRFLTKYATKHRLLPLDDMEAKEKNTNEIVDLKKSEIKLDGKNVVNFSEKTLGKSSKIVAKSEQGLPTIYDALKRIRFLTISVNNLAAELSKINLLTDTEAYQIIMNILLPETGFPMPEGFSTSKRQRNPRRSTNH
ncbi:BTB/POZ domain-containing protein 2-like [Malaya genurostris]|uniref:BTB/POZ domain-containing protein 2-like n=1 Tax=Malaya genurostris TaxID=325434 RepID=UPI0026F3D27B|nr:BTB/POZ domain-containing protein 2-like [Malaya genurostris]